MKAHETTIRGEKFWIVGLGPRDGVLKRTRVFGKTKDEALQRARDKRDELLQNGPELANISHAHRSIIIQWRDTLTPAQMMEAFKEYQERRQFARPVKDCVIDYIADKTKLDERGKAAWSKEQEKPARSRLSRFLEVFGERSMGTLIPGEIETFVRDRQASASNYHRLLRAFFGHARRHRWIEANPFEELGSAPSSDWEAKDLMTPAQFAGLLKIAAGMEDGYPRREPLLAAFVLGGLAGLRTAELRRLTWEKLDLKTGVISLDRETTRKRGLRGRKVQLELAALKWLRTLKKGEPGERVVGLSEKNFREARATIREAAKIDVWSHNILRRSFASHHLARFEDGAKTAATMGHTDAETTFAKYRVPATRKAGKAWFALTPEKVESMKV